MKAIGIVLTVLGGLMVLSAARLALMEYDLSTTHGQSKAFGGLGLSALILVAGISLIGRSRKRR